MTIKVEQQVQQYVKIAQKWGEGRRKKVAMEKYRELGQDEKQMSLLQRLHRAYSLRNVHIYKMFFINVQRSVVLYNQVFFLYITLANPINRILS